jgi:hypothetical protein
VFCVAVSFQCACHDVGLDSGEPWGKRLPVPGRTYNHCTMNSSVTLCRAAEHPKACSGRKKKYGMQPRLLWLYGCTTVAPRPQQSSMHRAGRWTPAALARQRPDVSPPCQLFFVEPSFTAPPDTIAIALESQIAAASGDKTWPPSRPSWRPCEPSPFASLPRQLPNFPSTCQL